MKKDPSCFRKLQEQCILRPDIFFFQNFWKNFNSPYSIAPKWPFKIISLWKKFVKKIRGNSIAVTHALWASRCKVISIWLSDAPSTSFNKLQDRRPDKIQISLKRYMTVQRCARRNFTLGVLPKIPFKLTQLIHVALQKKLQFWLKFFWIIYFSTLKPIKRTLGFILEPMKKICQKNSGK